MHGRFTRSLMKANLKLKRNWVLGNAWQACFLFLYISVLTTCRYRDCRPCQCPSKTSHTYGQQRQLQVMSCDASAKSTSICLKKHFPKKYRVFIIYQQLVLRNMQIVCAKPDSLYHLMPPWCEFARKFKNSKIRVSKRPGSSVICKCDTVASGFLAGKSRPNATYFWEKRERKAGMDRPPPPPLPFDNSELVGMDCKYAKRKPY